MVDETVKKTPRVHQENTNQRIAAMNMIRFEEPKCLSLFLDGLRTSFHEVNPPWSIAMWSTLTWSLSRGQTCHEINSHEINCHKINSTSQMLSKAVTSVATTFCPIRECSISLTFRL